MQKRKMDWLAFTFLLLQAFYPACNICAGMFGWSLAVKNAIGFSTAIAGVNAVMAAVIMFKKRRLTRRGRIFINLALPVGLINGIMLVLLNEVTACCAAAVSVICCFAAYGFAKGPKVLWISVGTVAGVLTVAMLGLMPFSLLFADFGASTVLKSIASPDGRHMAHVIDADQGALGGDTVVRVEKNSGLFRLLKPVCAFEKTVFIGPWGMGNEMSVQWMDENSLLVDGAQIDF